MGFLGSIFFLDMGCLFVDDLSYWIYCHLKQKSSWIFLCLLVDHTCSSSVVSAFMLGNQFSQ